MASASSDLGLGAVATVVYVNYRGEESVRHIIPYQNSLRYGVSEWHKTPGYLLKVHDVDKGEDREFAMSGIKKWL